MTNQKIQVLQDRFGQGALNTALWTGVPIPKESGGSSGALVGTAAVSIPALAGVDGPLAVSVPVTASMGALNCAAAGTGWTGITSVASYDLTGSGLSVQLASLPVGSGTIADFLIGGSVSGGMPQQWIAWEIRDGYGIGAQYGLPTMQWVPGTPPLVGYNPALHRFFRIREQSGTVYFDYSPDGSSWTGYGSMADPFDLTSVQVSIYANGPSQWANVDYVLAGS